MKNINEMVKDLIELGMTQSEIAKAIGRPQPTISEVLSGNQTDMYYMKGAKKLELLHKKVIKT